MFRSFATRPVTPASAPRIVVNAFEVLRQHGVEAGTWSRTVKGLSVEYKLESVKASVYLTFKEITLSEAVVHIEARSSRDQNDAHEIARSIY